MSRAIPSHLHYLIHFLLFPHQGLVGAPACGDVMKVRDRFFYAP